MSFLSTRKKEAEFANVLLQEVAKKHFSRSLSYRKADRFPSLHGRNSVILSLLGDNNETWHTKTQKPHVSATRSKRERTIGISGQVVNKR
jgi:hypothetical protein